jgi:hypothetical protein
VAALRQRYAEVAAAREAARPFELRLADRSSWRIGGDEGEPAFTVAPVSERGLAALASVVTPIRSSLPRLPE